jgi:hypothetical protein
MIIKKTQISIEIEVGRVQLEPFFFIRPTMIKNKSNIISQVLIKRLELKLEEYNLNLSFLLGPL